MLNDLYRLVISSLDILEHLGEQAGTTGFNGLNLGLGPG